MDLQTLLEVQNEVQRFDKKLQDAIGKSKFDPDNFHGSKESGAVKRAALDLKNELTKMAK